MVTKYETRMLRADCRSTSANIIRRPEGNQSPVAAILIGAHTKIVGSKRTQRLVSVENWALGAHTMTVSTQVMKTMTTNMGNAILVGSEPNAGIDHAIATAAGIIAGVRISLLSP
jgi:hypothetical protein